MFNYLVISIIKNYRQELLKKWEKMIASSENCCTFAPAELKEGLPLKMI